MDERIELKDKKLVVVGLARSGMAACRLAIKHGAQVTGMDQKTAEQLEDTVQALDVLGVKVQSGSLSKEILVSADLVVVSPGVPLNLPALLAAKEAQVPLISELELGARFCKGQIAAITGTNGKTTTVHLLHEIVKEAKKPCALAGNVGVPFCEVAESLPPDGIAVLEVSSFQLEAIASFRPQVAAILNITPDHLDRYENMQVYVEAKARIMRNQKPKDVLVLNGEDKYTPLLSNQAPGRVLTFSSKRPPEIEGCWAQDGRIYYRYFGLGQAVMMLADELLILGQHNLENALAASAMALALGIDPKYIVQTLKRFRSVPHRLEVVGKIEGVTYINDSKATNVDAVSKALESFNKPIILILGGRDKQGDFSMLTPLINRYCRAVVLMGEAAAVIEAQLRVSCPVKKVKTLQEAVVEARGLAQLQDVVLLSPGCASFDQFKNYEDRGEEFARLVKSMEANG